MADNFKFAFNMIDGYGKTSKKVVEFRDYAGVTPDLSLAQALVDAQAFAEALDDTTAAQIISVAVSFDLAGLFGGWALKGAPIAGSDLTEVAQYALIPDAPPFPNQRLPFAIPAPAASLFVNPGVSRVLDLAAAPLSALVALLEDTAGGEAQISDGQHVDVNAGSYGNGVSSGQFLTRKSSTPRQL